MTSNDGKFLSFTTPLMNTKIEKFELYIDNNRVSVRSLASVETDSYLYGLPSGTPDKMQIGSDSFVLVNHNLYKFPEDLSNLQGIKVGSSGYYKESKLHYHSTTGKIGVFHKKYDTCSVQIVDTGLETAVELDSSKLDGKLTGFHSDEVGNWRVEALDEANSVRTVYRIDPSTSALTLETADQFKAVNTGITVLIKRAN
jgi:hypothetical protein